MRIPSKPILLLALIAIATAIGLFGASLDDVSVGDNAADIVEAPRTPESPASDEAVVPTTTPTTAVEPTAAPTEAPADVATQAPTTVAQPTMTPTPEQTPRPQVPENTTGASIIVERGVSDRNLVALTFDAGEGPGYADEILDFLAQEGIHASFGLTGDWMRDHPDTVRRIVAEGHMIINHSESHQSWTGASTTGVPLSEDERIDELMGAAVAADEIAGYETAPFWRPPYGDYDAEGQALLADYGYDYTLYWTCDSLAWNGSTPQEIAERCAPDQPGGGPGAIILMHVTQEADYQSLPALVAEYKAAGYEFVTMEEMIAD